MKRFEILYRKSRETWDEEEEEAAAFHFHCVHSRADVAEHALVVGRYSVLPYYKELEEDLSRRHAHLINTHAQHMYIADLGSWYAQLNEVYPGITPETWFYPEHIPPNTPVVVKGATNSRKFSWKTHMFARDKQEAMEVAWRLEQDAVVGVQDLVYRRYVPLKRYLTSLQDLPITEEYRFFVYQKNILSAGYYWSGHLDQINDTPDPHRVPIRFLDTVIGGLNNDAFYTLDVARTEDDAWLVVEINDGQMSGLSENNPNILYANLRSVLLGRGTRWRQGYPG